MGIEFRKGDLFTSGAEALVNTVNCDGIMGGGIALEFKNRYPEYYKLYTKECKVGKVKVGKIGWYGIDDNTERGKLHILSFPTKDKIYNSSLISYIESGLKDLYRLCKDFYNDDYGFKSVAIPALGCGLEGLDWNEVMPLIVEELSDLNTHIMVYEPW